MIDKEKQFSELRERLGSNEMIIDKGDYYEVVPIPESSEEERAAALIDGLKQQLAPLKEKIEQDLWGEIVPDIDGIKQEAIRLHTEIRRLQGKPPRGLK